MPHLPICARARNACARTTGSLLERSGASASSAPQPTTATANSASCFAMSANTDAAIRNTGSCSSPRHRVATLAPPASTTALAPASDESASVPRHQSASVFISGSNSSNASMSVASTPASSACLHPSSFRSTCSSMPAAPTRTSFLTIWLESSDSTCGSTDAPATVPLSLSLERARRESETNAESCTPGTTSKHSGPTARASVGA
mmetsp:Transcript_17847/g.41536  ORF Transcript_17847/g.41536 Transcript_17847/m.41536 type:complete len:205 (+) Transcript_17847:235-849(+)